MAKVRGPHAPNKPIVSSSRSLTYPTRETEMVTVPQVVSADARVHLCPHPRGIPIVTSFKFFFFFLICEMFAFLRERQTERGRGRGRESGTENLKPAPC